MGASDIPQRNTRWLPVYFDAADQGLNESIPGFAAMGAYTNHQSRGQSVFEVLKTGTGISSTAEQVNSGRILFNGPTLIPPNAYGQATADFPARALILKSDWAENSNGTWGVVDGSWYLKPVANGPFVAFSSSFDSADVPLEETESLAWFVRSGQPVRPYSSAFRVSLTEIATGQPIAPMADIYRDPASDGLPQGVFSGSTGLTFTQSGSYLVGFSLSLYSNSAPRGAQLVVRLHLNGVATQYVGVRAQDIERDEYGVNLLTTYENVACSGPLKIASGQVLTLVNESNYPIVATPANMFAVLLFAHSVT